MSIYSVIYDRGLNESSFSEVEMNRIFRCLLGVLHRPWESSSERETIKWLPEWSEFLNKKVVFYRTLNHSDKRLFEERVRLFLETTFVEAGQFDVTDEDRLLVAASAVIPVWGFPEWHYFNVNKVFLLPASFNERFECGQTDSLMTGLVGTGPMSCKLALSRPALHLGFENSNDKHNVGIHEFVHLVDMADGDCDGFPERFKQYAFSIPWFDLVEKKIMGIENKSSNIGAYGATNKAEFLAVVSEYFFERPEMMQRKHPELYQALSDLYRQDVSRIADVIRSKKRARCPCGSGKRYKSCCMPKA